MGSLYLQNDLLSMRNTNLEIVRKLLIANNVACNFCDSHIVSQ